MGEPQRAALEQALIRWGRERGEIDAHRDRLVLAALGEGISKHRIHALTGIARTTIDRIVEGAPDGSD